MSRRLPSVAYEPPGEPSLFDRWEAGAKTDLPPPLAVGDAAYRSHVVGLLGRHADAARNLISVGAGTGHAEAALAARGWNVLATDPAGSALRICRGKGLATARFALLEDPPLGRFDVIYCDGVLGHLWDPDEASIPAWTALAALGRRDTICVVSNDLSDDDDSARFAVRTSRAAAFYRPPATWFGRDARATSLWSVESEHLYAYLRAGAARRREIIVARLLADERIEPEERL
ncbi:MAG TPA: class I SAM-dependent methyltransferase [Solirubrobacteraceae bacterium]